MARVRVRVDGRVKPVHDEGGSDGCGTARRWRSRGGGSPDSSRPWLWMPAFAGMTRGGCAGPVIASPEGAAIQGSQSVQVPHAEERRRRRRVSKHASERSALTGRAFARPLSPRGRRGGRRPVFPFPVSAPTKSRFPRLPSHKFHLFRKYAFLFSELLLSSFRWTE